MPRRKISLDSFLKYVFPLPTRSFVFRYRFFYSIRSLVDKFIVIFRFLVDKFCSYKFLYHSRHRCSLHLDSIFFRWSLFFYRYNVSSIGMPHRKMPAISIFDIAFHLILYFPFLFLLFFLSTTISFFMFHFSSILFYHCITLAIHNWKKLESFSIYFNDFSFFIVVFSAPS